MFKSLFFIFIFILSELLSPTSLKSKKIISLFLCLVLGIQVLPFRQIAAWLSANQFSEEIPSEIGVVKAKSVSPVKHSDFQNANAFEFSSYLQLKKANHHHSGTHKGTRSFGCDGRDETNQEGNGGQKEWESQISHRRKGEIFHMVERKKIGSGPFTQRLSDISWCGKVSRSKIQTPGHQHDHRRDAGKYVISPSNPFSARRHATADQQGEGGIRRHRVILLRSREREKDENESDPA